MQYLLFFLLYQNTGIFQEEIKIFGNWNQACYNVDAQLRERRNENVESLDSYTDVDRRRCAYAS